VTNKRFVSIRWKVLLAFFLIIGLSSFVMARTMTRLMSDYMVDQRVRSDRAGLEKWAVQAAPLLFAADTETLSWRMAEAGREMNGRVLLIDRDGKVQTDTFHEANGTRVNVPEVADVLSGAASVGHGVYSLDSGEKAKEGQLKAFGIGDEWVSYSTASLVHASDVIGVIMLVSSAREMVKSMNTVRENMLMIYAAVVLAALLSGMIFTRVITKPIGELTAVIRQMSKGTFSARVPEHGSGEIRQLASAFNSMSEKLETLDQSRNQFVSNASHELKTPLATMKIMIESLIYQPEMEQELRTEFLTDVNLEIDRLSRIVSELLTLVHADSHSMKLDREKMSLSAVVKETAHRLEPLIEQKKQTLSLQLQDSGDMFADREKLKQVVYNILDNAVKYTHEGGQVQVSLQRVGRDVLLQITDDGPGIPRDSLPHVFDRFYRVDRARSRESGGTGLGLSIAQQIVALHGGIIRVDSEEGKGTTFTVELPLHKG
jgi:two-component system OmpR family sensor kinase